MKEAPSNKAARNIGGETFHNANKLNPTSSLLTPHLRQKPRQQAAMRRFAQLGAKLFDEFSQALAKLWHADAYCTAVARAAHQSDNKQATELQVDTSKYAEKAHSWGGMPIVIVCGDELQFPPVPMQGGLLAPIEGTSSEQKTSVKIFIASILCIA